MAGSIEHAEKRLMDALEDFLTTEQAAEVLGTYPQAIRHLAHSKRIRAIKIGRDWLINKDVIAEYKRTKSARGRPTKRENLGA